MFTFVKNLFVGKQNGGGGAARDLAERLERNKRAIDATRTKLSDITNTFNVQFTAYVDAVQNGSASPENRAPLGTGHHLNLYQTYSWVFYGMLLTDDLPASIEQINVNTHTGWILGTLTHFTIDDNIRVKQKLLNDLRLYVTAR
jgi:hypothetical protein